MLPYLLLSRDNGDLLYWQNPEKSADEDDADEEQ
ncbi:hypothetical protein chiPu_0031188, partial [Chiloscyllium punctatum]|nr:hypothetical protein [Chiloscyllium punctatum]